MYRQPPSAATARSGSFYGLPSASQIQPSISTSSTKSLDKDALNPDELFTKHSVAEVKVIEQRLRHDAEVKQEELRLMVGERYRDLIQASSSIISMAASSQRVLTAFQESKGAIFAQQEPPLPSRTSTLSGVNDRHLHALQTLSAHLKVLLDAPEHLWRLIERKRYLSAAWLFLFIRVVHRGLVHQDDDEEESWLRVGIDVPIDFPLVQRQWDEVSSFRSQIIHKATLSLRELTTTAQDVCATLTALHLLDSRPLSDTLAALLTQRSKALTPLVSRRLDSKVKGSANGSARTTEVPAANSVLHANQDVLNTIIYTITTAREVFDVLPERKQSLITALLKSIQSEPQPTDDSLPPDLLISTHSLLVNSTSSAHFLLLPTNLQSYRPYVDLSSASTNYSQIEFQRALQGWMTKSSKSWHDASDAWFTALTTVAEVWDTRASLRQRIETSQLESSEKQQVSEILDNICRSRILSLWTSSLSFMQDAFKKQLSSSLKVVNDKPESPFKVPPLPTASLQASKVLDPAPFHCYQNGLKQHLLGRSARLDSALSALEKCARSIQNDLSIVSSDATDSGKSFRQALVDAYQPKAESATECIASTLEEAVERALGESDSDSLVALANIADDLASSSIFSTHIGCRHTAIQIAGPSPLLFHCLSSLSDALRQVGVRPERIRHRPIVKESLRAFIRHILSEDAPPPQFHDLCLLRAMASKYGPELEESVAILSDTIGKSSMPSQNKEQDDVASEYLARTQTLLSTLLPCSTHVQTSTPAATNGSISQARLLLFDTPSTKQEYQSALEVAKPSPRFGLLLVNSSENP
ncbi:hypothetical protein BKA70DRAFT_1091376 [Coprinopsis sp. MPI-PUGE-AT-0042]|nr:hypothetical protein BKA70DRAFT_1091376 [Coprinopsis sp. MPI-PUGE-AT-0042]